MSKRKLTRIEVFEILSQIKPLDTQEVLKSSAESIKQDIKNQLESVSIYPSKIPNLIQEIKKHYYTSLIEAGDSVGIFAAQSVGERQTQLTLNTFHSAGLTTQTVVTGVPRFSELLNATKNPKSSSMKIFLKSNNESIESLRNEVKGNIKQIYFRDLINSFKIYENKPREKWYDIFDILYSTNYKEYKFCISYILEKELLFKNFISVSDIADKISIAYNDLECVFSTNEEAQLDIYVDISNINIEENLLFLTKENIPFIYLEEVVDIYLREVLITGIPNIIDFFYKEIPQKEPEFEKIINFNLYKKITLKNRKKILPSALSTMRVKSLPNSAKVLNKWYCIDSLDSLPNIFKTDIWDNGIPSLIYHISSESNHFLFGFLEEINCWCLLSENNKIFVYKNDEISIASEPKQNLKSEWYIETVGTNFREFFKVESINHDKISSNNPWDIYEVFGIEAARQSLIDQFEDVISSDGTYINDCHIKLLVDIMTFSGNIISISRYGMRKDQSGPLAKASFEESLDNFLKAGIFCEDENSNGVSASIMCGKRSQIGTGLCDLKFNTEKFIEEDIEQDLYSREENMDPDLLESDNSDSE